MLDDVHNLLCFHLILIHSKELKDILLTLAVSFIRHISAVVITITDPTCWDTTTSVSTLELVFTTCYTNTFKTLARFCHGLELNGCIIKRRSNADGSRIT